MSTTIGAISSVLPTHVVAKAESGLVPSQAQGEVQESPAAKPDLETEAVAPMPIQPLSSRMLATFMQEDIELYGSMFGP
ncbi:MAG: hypothetical protein JSS43_13485 [Proteobacteria bacterium]|nr:hypothetical protein [Pseudomonadota bacterium]